MTIKNEYKIALGAFFVGFSILRLIAHAASNPVKLYRIKGNELAMPKMSTVGAAMTIDCSEIIPEMITNKIGIDFATKKSCCKMLPVFRLKRLR